MDTQCVSLIVKFWCKMTAMTFLLSSVSGNSWDFLLHSRGEEIGRVSLKESHKTPEHTLQKRSSYFHHTDLDDGHNIDTIYRYPGSIDNNIVDHNRFDENDDDKHLPLGLAFTFNFQGHDVSMRLKKNKLLTSSPAPVYFVHDGVIMKADDVLHKQNPRTGFNAKPSYGLYHDPDLGASMMVTRGHQNGYNYHVTGTFFQDGEEFSIRPIMGYNDGKANHVISRLLQEANLLHDVIDLDKDISFAATLTSNDLEDTDENGFESSNNDTNVLTNNDDTDDILNNEDHIQIDAQKDDITRSFSSYESDDKRIDDILNSAKTLRDKNEKDQKSKNDMENRFYNRRETTQSTNDVNTEKNVKEKLGVVDFNGTKERNNREESSDGNEGEGENRESRKKRQAAAKKYVVELLIVVDYGVYETWLNGVTDREGDEKKEEAVRRIKQFYSFVINGVDLRYKSVNKHADYTVDVTWAGIIIFDTPDPTYWENTATPPKSSRDFVESSAALEAFRAWAEQQGTTLPPSDHVMLFTGHNLTYGGSVSNAGLAYLGSACNPDYFFSIVEEYFEFRDVAIAAHELGHSLGARHDMDGNTCLSFNRYIMTPRFKFPSLRKAKNPWLFSSCSVSYFTDFIESLDKNDTNCFITKDSSSDGTEIQPFLVSLPGEVYSGDDFCRIGGGPGSFICRDEYIKDYQSTCYRGLLCYDPIQQKCVSKLPPNGMSCGNKKWCMNGTCSESNLAPANSGDDCPFGDTPNLIGGRTCAQRALTTRNDCYRASFRAQCCESCRKYRRNLPGCEYGDQFELCERAQCVNYDEDYARENCCDTCADLLFTIPTTVATTPAPTTTTTSRTTTVDTVEEVVTVSKGGSKTKGGETGKGEGGVSPTGREKNKGENNRGRKAGRRNYVNSDESFESDESMPRTRKNSRQGNQGRSRYGSRQSNGRLVQIQSLLQAMKDARDNDRLQRLRLLVYLLDRTLGLGLADLRLGQDAGKRNGNRVGSDEDGDADEYTGDDQKEAGDEDDDEDDVSSASDDDDR